jgi:hypothetical protein
VYSARNTIPPESATCVPTYSLSLAAKRKGAVSVYVLNVVTATAVVVFTVAAAIKVESTKRLVVPPSLLTYNTKDDAVTVARGIAVKRVKIAPSEPAVNNRTVFDGLSSVIVATAVATAVAVLGD